MTRLLLLLMPLALLACGGTDRPAGEAAPAAASTPRYVAEGVRWTRLDAQGQPLFVAEAEQVQVYDDRRAVLSEPRLAQLAGRAEGWRLAAPRGEASAGLASIRLDQGVEAQGHWPDGEPLQLRTPALRYEPQAQRLSGSEPIEVRSDSREARAEGFEASVRRGTLRLLGQVRIDYAS